MTAGANGGIEAAIVLRSLREAGETLIASENRVADLIAERQHKGKELTDRSVERALDELLYVVVRAQASLAAVSSELRRDGSSLDEAVASLDVPKRRHMDDVLGRLSEYRGVGATREVLAVVVSLLRRRAHP